MALCHRFVGSKSSAKAGQTASSFVPDKQQVTTTGSASTTQTIVTSMNSSDDPQRPQLEIVNPAAATTTTTGLSRSGSTLAHRVLSLFRSRSEPDVPSAKQPPPSDRRRRLTGPPRSTSASPCGGSVSASTGQRRGSGGGGSAAIKTLHQRRRYQRVVRDENARPPDTLDDNPFVTRKFTQEYLSNYYADKKPLPTDASISLISPGSHPILKKRSSGEHRTFTSGSGSCTSTDDELGSSLPSTITGTSVTSLPLTPTSRHTKFREVVEIVEYQMRDRVTEKLNSRTQSVRLNDSDDEGPVVISVSGSEGARERDVSSDSIDDGTRDSCDDEVPAEVRNVTPPLCSPSHHRCRPPPKHRRLEGFEEEDNEDAELTKN